MIFNENSMPKLLEFLHIVFIFLVRFRKVPNAKYCIKTNGFSMFLSFARFGKQLKNSKENYKKQARKSNEKNMETSLKNHLFFINVHDFFRHEKCIDFFMHFSWKMGSKMEPKSMPKSYSNDFGRPKGRPGPIVNVFRSKKDGKRVLQNRCKKMMRNLEASGYRPLRFGASVLEPAGR